MSANKLFRAGIIPYYIDDTGVIKFMFMKPSNPNFGGPDWQIAKGRVEDGDDNITTAYREGQEELGLKLENIKSVEELGLFLGRTVVYICEIFDPTDFNEFHWETGDTIWLSIAEFNDMGRELHRDIVQAAFNKVVTSVYMSQTVETE